MRCLDWLKIESFERVELLVIQDASTSETVYDLINKDPFIVDSFGDSLFP